MRAFVVPNAEVEELKSTLARAGLNAWVGPHLGQTIIRFAFNVYNDAQDIDRFVNVLEARVA